ncbi:MAG: lysophospholipid acyltransferase family protein [Candidatus Omnitrophota bacterium]|nr:lysophospholipid acyltransferase family protein [Candidatus Omnitrophota bacterium]
MFYSFLRSLGIIIFKILFRFQVRGLKYIPEKGGFILASNHASYLDPILLGIACRRPLNYMAKKELFHNRLLSIFFLKINIFPVKRDSADIKALKEAMRRLKMGGALVLFPEGSRRFDSTSGEPYPGVGFLSAKVGVPIVPAFIKGTQEAWPKNTRLIRPKKISVTFGKKISYEKGVSYQEIAQLIMASIRELSCQAVGC